MAYEEKDGNIILTLSVEDYEGILLALGCATGVAGRDGRPAREWFQLVNRINEGNPKFTPYVVEG